MEGRLYQRLAEMSSGRKAEIVASKFGFAAVCFPFAIMGAGWYLVHDRID